MDSNERIGDPSYPRIQRSIVEVVLIFIGENPSGVEASFVAGSRSEELPAEGDASIQVARVISFPSGSRTIPRSLHTFEVLT